MWMKPHSQRPGFLSPPCPDNNSQINCSQINCSQITSQINEGEIVDKCKPRFCCVEIVPSDVDTAPPEGDPAVMYCVTMFWTNSNLRHRQAFRSIRFEMIRCSLPFYVITLHRYRLIICRWRNRLTLQSHFASGNLRSSNSQLIYVDSSIGIFINQTYGVKTQIYTFAICL